MEERARQAFPPTLIVGNRVWTVAGYHDHGPIEGPKVDIAPNQGGTIAAIQKPYYTIDHLLYTVLWITGSCQSTTTKSCSVLGGFKIEQNSNRQSRSLERWNSPSVLLVDSVTSDLNLNLTGSIRQLNFGIEICGWIVLSQ